MLPFVIKQLRNDATLKFHSILERHEELPQGLKNQKRSASSIDQQSWLHRSSKSDGETKE